MEISKNQLAKAASKLGFSEKDITALWNSLEEDQSKESTFSKLLYYVGAIIVISAMTWFMSVGWESFGGGGLFLISVVYAAAFLLMGARLWKKPGLEVPAGLLITMAVCMTPLAIYGLEEYLGIFQSNPEGSYQSLYSRINSSWIWMEIGTIIAGMIALRFFPFSFLMAPICFAVWFLSMDAVPLIIGEDANFDQKAWISSIFGGILLAIGYAMDIKKMTDYSFWAYLFGTIAFWGGLGSIVLNKGEVYFLVYLLINVLMMIAGVLLQRKVLVVFGAIGTFLYFAHLAYDVFKDSILFPFALSFLGLVIIYLGVLYQKNSKEIETKLFSLVPHSLRKFLP